MRDAMGVLALITWVAFFGSRFMRNRGLPELLGFLLVGAALGPAGLRLINEAQLAGLAPVVEIALGLLMFSIGRRISTHSIRERPWSLVVGALPTALSTVLIFFACIWVGASTSEALLLGVLGGAGAPMTIAHITNRYNSNYGKGLVASHAVGDSLAAVAFSIALPLAALLEGEGTSADALLDFIKLSAGGAVLGLVTGMIMWRLTKTTSNSGEHLVIVIIHIVIQASISYAFDLSLPLAALTSGFLLATISSYRQKKEVFEAFSYIEEPLYLLFFTLAGASIHFSELRTVGYVGIAYVLARSLGKIGGGFIAAKIETARHHSDFTTAESLQLGLDSIPQAGVAVGLAVIAAEQLPDIGGQVAAVVLGSVIIFEAVGPLLVKRGMDKYHSENLKTADELH